MTHTLHLGDCRTVMATLDDNSIDSIVCDPPYELGFMGKAWDNSGIAYDVTIWQQCLRVLKPGGHLIAFGGSRTYHRLAVAIEDAGFEIRDQIQWIYGSGFPKSLDVSKAMDKQAGATREVISKKDSRSRTTKFGGELTNPEFITAPVTDIAKQWDGWGTAAKPAFEPAVLAYKPHEAEHGIIIANLQRLEAQLWLMWFASTAEWNSTSSPHDLSVVLSIAQWTAAELIHTRDDLCGQMDTSQFAEVMTSCLSIVTSWKNIWSEASNAGNTFITETVLSPIIGWTTLKSSLSHLTLNFITREWTQHGGDWLGALSAASPFIVASKKLKSTLELIAVERAISRTSNPGSIDAKTTNEPAVLARKPLCGTVADNVTTWGVGGLNIDGTRVGTSKKVPGSPSTNKKTGAGFTMPPVSYGSGHDANIGRWPANVILDEDAAVALDMQSGERKSGGGNKGGRNETAFFGSGSNYNANYEASTGGASRFFYTAKASRAEREAGLYYDEWQGSQSTKWSGDGMPLRQDGSLGGEPVQRANHHPTVKPLALMRYLVRLVTPKGGKVLDPFMGSGSTGCAAVLEGFDFVGIDITPEYVAIAQKRIDHYAVTSPLEGF
jgi:DNA modification methylase